MHERQLILIHEEESNDSNVLHVNPNHHPIIMLRKTQVDSSKILEVVACHDNRVVKNNIFRTNNSEWTIKRNIVGPYPTERLGHSLICGGTVLLIFPVKSNRICNDGNLPLYGRNVRASVFAMTPWVYTDENKELKGGIIVEIFKVIAEYLEFDYEIVLRSNWFRFFENGTVGESLGDVS